MAYVALYRKWRPGDFANLVGQEHISKTLANAIRTGRIAHAYLFSGPRGTGKTSTAKILAKSLNCDNGPTETPCNECENCRKINEGTSMDVFEIDAASNRGIDEIRELRETVKFAPVNGRYKIYIIDEVHMLTTEAFNALLKTLEEPPAHVVFILATTEAHKVPATIQSRCQRYDFKRITVGEIVDRLSRVAAEMKLAIEPEALRIIAVHADGGLRDALSILDQCSALEQDNVTAERVRGLLGIIGSEMVEKLVDCIAENAVPEALETIDKLTDSGKSVIQILNEIAFQLRNVMVYQSTKSYKGLEACGASEETLQREAEKLPYERIVYAIECIHNAVNEAKWSPQPRITLEVAMVTACRPKPTAAVGENSAADNKAVEALETKLSSLENMVRQLTAVRQTAPPVMADNSRSDDRPRTHSSAVPVNTNRTVSTPVMPPVIIDGNGRAVWEQLLKELIRHNKRSIHACVSQGWLQSFTNGQLTIGFSMPFTKERTEKADYRGILQDILREICGSPILVRCILETPVDNTPVKKAPFNPARPPVEKMPPEQRQVVDTAVKIFGDNFVNKEDLKR